MKTATGGRARRSVLALATMATVVTAVAGCDPSTVADAEARGKAKWLDTQGSPEAVAALGRLADKDPEAAQLLEARSKFDVNAMVAAWSGVKRSQAWATNLLKAGLADSKRTEFAASSMARQDPLLVPFVPDLEAALARQTSGGPAASLGTLLASVGPAAHAAIVKRLADGATRTAMCTGIGTSDASADARTLLISVPPTSRDSSSCVDTTIALAAASDATLAWLGGQAEPGLLTAAANAPAFPCARLHVAWTHALSERPPEQQGALTVPLSAAIKRCSQQLDGVLADSLRTGTWNNLVVQSLAPYAVQDATLTATCAGLPHIDTKGMSSVLKERQGDILAYGCRGRQR
jgi:hypothetical protein